MNNLLQNQVGCDLMIWETDSRKRNTNNEVKFVVPTSQDVKVGDVLVGNYSAKSISCYEITEIKERRKAAQHKRDYLIVKTKWTNKKPNFSNFTLITNSSFNQLFNLK
ncbi:MAG: hypothetical protein KDD03_02110 [Gelidibacter sp.]|nr:hypothetical protein [Gelidibacter sp.]